MRAVRPLLAPLLLLTGPGAGGCGAFAPPSSRRASSPGRLLRLPRRRLLPTRAPRGPCLRAPSPPTRTSAVAPGAGADLRAAAVSAASAASAVLHSPTLWSVLAMTSIVALLVAWEEAVEKVQDNTPEPIRPVIDSMLAEVGGLGFIGLFLSTVVTGGPLGQVVGSISEEFLGDEELLLETFEFLHTYFFEVGVSFFLINGVVIWKVLQEVQQLEEISDLALDADGDGEVTLDELAEALDVDSVIVDLDGDGVITEEEKVAALRAMPAPGRARDLLREYSMSVQERAGEQLVIRERMMQERALPPTFAVEDYFSRIFGKDLEEVVELAPVTWLPLIPLIALDNSVDLARDVVSASSSNAYDSCGYFFADPFVLYSTIFLQTLSLAWSLFNFWKVSSIKQMLLPTLVRETSDSEAILLPPRYLDDVLLARFDSSPSFFRWVEDVLAHGGAADAPPAPRNAHERLFGATGAAFPRAYRDSLRLNTWLCIALLLFSTTQIIFRDASAVYAGASVGDPETLVPELVLWSVFAVSAVFQLSLAPTTFLNYCLVTSVEEFVDAEAMSESILNDPNCLEAAMLSD